MRNNYGWEKKLALDCQSWPIRERLLASGKFARKTFIPIRHADALKKNRLTAIRLSIAANRNPGRECLVLRVKSRLSIFSFLDAPCRRLWAVPELQRSQNASSCYFVLLRCPASRARSSPLYDDQRARTKHRDQQKRADFQAFALTWGLPRCEGLLQKSYMIKFAFHSMLICGWAPGGFFLRKLVTPLTVAELFHAP